MMARDDYYDDDEFYDDEGRMWPLRLVGLAVVALGVFALVWFGLIRSDGGGGADQQLASADIEVQPTDVVESATTDPDLEETDEQPVSPDDLDDDPEGEDAGVDIDVGADPGTTAPTTDTPVDTAAGSTAPVAAQSEAPASVEPNYPTLPDGSPVPVLVIYDGELITLSGTVPSEAAAQRLQVLAVANSAVPGAEVASFLAIEPSVPVGVGVRVIEMNSARFPEGSPEVSPEHSAQLDRIVAVMNALPHITVNVIGHADQRGDAETNFKLSADRARAAADYVASQGVDPSRLSSRGAGESDLLTLNNDEAALALNRRTELVFFGLLIDPAAPA